MSDTNEVTAVEVPDWVIRVARLRVTVGFGVAVVGSGLVGVGSAGERAGVSTLGRGSLSSCLSSMR